MKELIWETASGVNVYLKGRKYLVVGPNGRTLETHTIRDDAVMAAEWYSLEMR